MIFQDEHNTQLSCIGQASLYTFRSQFYTIIVGNSGPSLTGEHPAIGTAENMRHFDPSLLLFNFFLPEPDIRMREVRRATEHGDLLTPLFHLPAKNRPVFF